MRALKLSILPLSPARVRADSVSRISLGDLYRPSPVDAKLTPSQRHAMPCPTDQKIDKWVLTGPPLLPSLHPRTCHIQLFQALHGIINPGAFVWF